MKRIIMIKGLQENDHVIIMHLMECENIPASFSIDGKSLVVDGNNDVLAYAKRLLLENGYTIL